MKRNESEFLEFAKDMSRSAGKILMGDFGKAAKQTRKKDGSFVTETDFKADSYITGEIKKRYPDHSILSEESGRSDTGSEYMWIIDPLDGTHNFMFGLPLFGVSVALARKEKVIAGAIYLPFFDWLFHATKGDGALMNGKKIRVSERNERGAFIGHSSKSIRPGDIERLIGIGLKIRMLGVATANFSWIAQGMIDAYVTRSDQPHDIAAGCLLVEEAGGRVTEIDGRPWSIWSKNLIASSGRFHEKLIEALKK